MRHYWLLLVTLLLASPTWCGELRATVLNSKGEAVSQAVVYARPVGNSAPPAIVQPAVIDQIDKEFVPALTVIHQGAEVSFPNNDNIRHHVYSFSKSNAFEIPLYANVKTPPIVFDNPGVIALGCNVHDWMTAYVFVADTPYYGVTDESGTIIISPLPAGEYIVEVWHAQLRGKPAKLAQNIVIADSSNSIDFSIKQKKVWKAWRDSGNFGEGY